MPLVVLEAFVKNPPRGMRRKFASLKRESLREVAWFWHTNILQSHFTPGNTGRYQIETRNRKYKEVIKKEYGEGQGKYVELQFKGRSLRWLKAFASVTATATQSTLRMRAPTYFAKPFIGSFTDPKTGRRKIVTRQPNKPAEVKQVNQADRAKMVRFIQRGIVRGWKTGKVDGGRQVASVVQ